MTREHWHEGRVAVVTGGGSGIGLAIARALGERGARVVTGGRRAGNDAARIRAEAGAGAAALDVRDPASVERFVAGIEARLGPPSILVNAAGITLHRRVAGHDEAGWLDVIDTNLTGPFRMIRRCLPAMIAAGWGRIVNIASTAARTAEPDYGAYCASKAGLVGLTRVVALEGAPHGVTCLAVSPTWVQTPMLDASAREWAAASGRSPADEIARLAGSVPQNRLVQPAELGELVSFLCSELAPGLTMEDIQINAGALW